MLLNFFKKCLPPPLQKWAGLDIRQMTEDYRKLVDIALELGKLYPFLSKKHHEFTLIAYKLEMQFQQLYFQVYADITPLKLNFIAVVNQLSPQKSIRDIKKDINVPELLKNYLKMLELARELVKLYALLDSGNAQFTYLTSKMEEHFITLHFAIYKDHEPLQKAYFVKTVRSICQKSQEYLSQHKYLSVK